MANKSKIKGTTAETRVVNYLTAAGLDASRVVLKGSHDQGDIHFTVPGDPQKRCLEVKAGRQTQSISRKQREIWLAETRREAQTSGLTAYLVIAKYGSSVPDYHVWSSDGHLFWYLDEFVGSLVSVAPAQRKEDLV